MTEIFKRGEIVERLGERATVLSGNENRIGVVIQYKDGRKDKVQHNQLKRVKEPKP